MLFWYILEGWVKRRYQPLNFITANNEAHWVGLLAFNLLDIGIISGHHMTRLFCQSVIIWSTKGIVWERFWKEMNIVSCFCSTFRYIWFVVCATVFFLCAVFNMCKPSFPFRPRLRLCIPMFLRSVSFNIFNLIWHNPFVPQRPAKRLIRPFYCLTRLSTVWKII